MDFTRRQRIGGLVLVCALAGIVSTAAVVTANGAPAEPSASRATDSAQRAATSPTVKSAPRPKPADTVAPVSADPAVQKQLDYMLAHWQSYNTDGYGVVTDNDCVNFTSQSLVERGWRMDDEWWTSGTGSDFEHSSPWVSSTAFRDYLQESGRATALTADQADKVKLGDVVQFDWDNSGDRDHTGVVTRIDPTGPTRQIYYAGHTDDSDYRSVEWAITVNHPGGSVYYWSVP